MGLFDAGDQCTSCGHPFSLHAHMAVGHDPGQGGVVLCPVRDCPCYTSWAPGEDRPENPEMTAEEINRLRTSIQTGEM